MEEFTVFVAIIFVVFGILQIILFFKIWLMTNDTKEILNNMNKQTECLNLLTTHFCKEEYIKSCNYSLKSKGITCVVDGYKVTYSDGVVGELKQNGSNATAIRYSFLTDDNYQLMYKTRDLVCAALHEYLTNKNEVKAGLVKKVKYE